MVMNESKNLPPLSTALMEAEHLRKLLSEEANGLGNQRAQLGQDVRAGTITREQSDELEVKLSARRSEIQDELFALALKISNLK